MNILQNIAQMQTISQDDRKNWYIPEEITTKFPIVECNEPLVMLKHIAHGMGVSIILAPVAPKENPEMYLRESVAQKICHVVQTIQEKTDGAYTLKVYDTFRPLSLQRKYFSEITADIAAREGLNGDALWKRVTQFIADPDLCPPHSTGGAIDCTIVSVQSGEELDMGTTVDAISDKSNTWNDSLNDQEIKNRHLLFDAMESVGMVNLATEWWHYSYGDQYWAIYSDQKNAIFGSLETI